MYNLFSVSFIYILTIGINVITLLRFGLPVTHVNLFNL